jgi:hypothetical protein
MAGMKVKVVARSYEESVNGKPYMKLTLEPGGKAYCWRPGLFERIDRAYDNRHRGWKLSVEVEASDDQDPMGRPYMHVIEARLLNAKPGQQDLALEGG